MVLQWKITPKKALLIVLFVFTLLLSLPYTSFFNPVITQVSPIRDELQTPAVSYANLYLTSNSSTTEGFHFTNLVMSLENVNNSRLDPHSNTSFTGTLLYEDTAIPPSSGKSALRLEGKSYINCSTDSSLLWSNAGSMAFWVNTDLKNTWQHVLTKRGYGISDDVQGYEFNINAANQIGFIVRTNVTAYVSPRYSLDDGWHFFVGTWGNNELKLYVDGIQFGPPIKTNGTITIGENYPLYIGARQPGYGFATGIIDEIRVYNRALLLSEVWEHYQGVYSNTSGLVLHLPFDGDINDRSSEEQQCVLHGSTYAGSDGYVNIDIVVELNGTIKKIVSLVNSSTGWFSVSLARVEELVGRYCYKIYPSTFVGNNVQGQILCIIVDRVRIVEGGITETSSLIGETQTVWLKALYEFDDSEFNGESGVLFLNGYDMEWSEDNRRWESRFNPVLPGDVMFKITGFVDRTYGLTNMYDDVGFQSITVNERVNPVSWINVLLLVTISIFSLLRIFGFKIEKKYSETKKVLY